MTKLDRLEYWLSLEAIEILKAIDTGQFKDQATTHAFMHKQAVALLTFLSHLEEDNKG